MHQKEIIPFLLSPIDFPIKESLPCKLINVLPKISQAKPETVATIP